MKNSFKIFSLIAGLLVILIILRLNSISYPRDIEDNTEVVYLEELRDHGSLFDIEYNENRFLLKPRTGNIKVNGAPATKTLEIENENLIAIDNRSFIFNIFPRPTAYREIFNRPLREVFYNFNDTKFIGGWTNTHRETLLAREHNRKLLKKLIVEIAAPILKRVFPGETAFDGKLLELRRSKNPLSRELEVKSSHLSLIRVRNWREKTVEKETPITIRDGDILKFPYRDSQNALFIKFNIIRLRALVYLSVSYKEKEPLSLENEPSKEIAFLKSLDTGVSYNISRDRKNAFIGNRGLYSFNLNPSHLLDKLYLPDKIPEGGVVDIKELLDRRMYYKEDNRYYPVTREFLYRLKNEFREKDREGILDYFEKNDIQWREFESYSQFKGFLNTAEQLILKMENKDIYRTFAREIEKLNDTHRILGVGVGGDRRLIRGVTYKRPGRSWLTAFRVRANTPVVGGIDTFYWGAGIEDTDESVQFKITFKQTPPPPFIKLIAASDYRYGFNGRDYTEKNFFDGVQTIAFPGGKKEIFIIVSNIKTFNKTLGSTNFQAEVFLKNPGGETLHITTGDTWEASVNNVHWGPALVDPPYGRPDPAASHLRSIWYFEKWDPVYSGIKFRYFRKKFQLEDKPLPRSVTWKIFASGDYSLRVNRDTVQTEADFKKALKKGENVLTVMVSRKGYRKHFYTGTMFKTANNRILLKQRQVQRASFKKARGAQKPFISDIAHTPLAYSSIVNGKSRRFYTPRTLPVLQSFLGSPGEGIWGLEQVFSRLDPGDKIAGLQLTLNREWQTIALDAMKEILHANREKELKNSKYLGLKKDLNAAGSRLTESRRALSTAGEDRRRQLMQTVVQSQNEVEELKEKINKIKNHFYEASVVLMGPGGEILTAASYPYDEETMKSLNPDISRPYRPRENPYFNRGWQWKYNPGSTAKILDAAAFLHSGSAKDENGNYLFPYLRSLLSSRNSFKDFPRLDLKNTTMLNGKEIVFRLRNFQGHIIPEGFCSLKQAFAHSYNTYFSYLALHNNRVLTHDSLVYDHSENERNKRYFISRANIPISRTYIEYPTLWFAERLFLNRKIDLLYNLREMPFASRLFRMPNDVFMAVESRFPVNAYTSANIAHYSIGQGDFQLTALQNAMIASTVLNRGVLYYPSIIKSVSLKDSGEPLELKDNKIEVFSASIADHIKEAMEEVVKNGTADKLFKKLKKGRRFYAKTGTAETEVYQDNSLFVGFVTFTDDTPLIFSVIVPRSGTGAKVAGKLIEDILTAIIDHENKKGGSF